MCEVDWGYQRVIAEQCVAPLMGVRELVNRITVKPRTSQADIASQITAALTRHAQREARHLGIDVEGSVVTLSGRVYSLAEHEAALGAALSTHGVSRVVDKLEVAA